MLGNYFKTAFRNFRRHKVYTFINLLSLCIGITCALFIFTYIKHTLSYDQFFKNAHQIYRLENTSSLTGKTKSRYAFINKYSSPGPLQSITAIENHTHFTKLSDIYAKANNKKIAETNFGAGDSSFFTLFDFSLIEGTRNNLLHRPKSIVLTQKIARKYFGKQKTLGKFFTVISKNQKVPLTVTGVVKVPSNTHLQFDAIVSKDVYYEIYMRHIKDTYSYNYVQIKKGANPKKVEQQLAQIRVNPYHQFINYQLRPLTKIHLHSADKGELRPNTNIDIRYIYFLTAIALILLIIAGVNFTSLAAAQNLQRYKEAGIRKVMGANCGQLIRQFLSEAIGLSLLALAVGYFMIDLTLPYFNNLAGTTFEYSAFLNWTSVGIFVALSIALGIIAGLYPAMLLSSFQPIKTLKDISPSGKKGAVIWKSIVVIQFAASITMIICTLTIFRQLRYIQNKDLGFDKNRIITIAHVRNKHYALLKSHLKSIPGIKNISISTFIPGVSKTGGTGTVQIPGRSDSLTFNWISVGYNFFNTYNIKLRKGRVFSKDYGTDSTQAYMLNETAVKALGLKSPLGKKIKALGEKPKKIIGVTDNFNYFSLYQSYPPIIYLVDTSLYSRLSIKIASSSSIPNTIAQIKKTWRILLPNTPFIYQFVDQQFDALYITDQQMGKIFGVFALLALVVSCLGIYSLSSFMATRKRKEIGVRKVLGASIKNILFSFYSNYGKLVAAACVIAIPASYFFLRSWLQNFAFRIAMPVGLFLLAIIATLLVAGLAVTYESLKASLVNPVDSIRS